MRVRKYILILLFLLLPSLGLSANNYIRQGATGTGTGVDWTNAWTDLPSTFVRGDTYYIADGTYGHHDFAQAESGATYIYIYKATASAHGTDTGWNSSYGDGQAHFNADPPTTFAAIVEFSSGYWVFDGKIRGTDIGDSSLYGFKITPVTLARTLSGIGMPSQNDGSNQLDHIQISHTAIIMPGSAYNYSQLGICSEASTELVRSTNLVISNNYIGYGSNNLEIIGTTGMIIENNYFDSNWTSSEWHGAQNTFNNNNIGVIIRNNYYKNSVAYALDFHKNQHTPPPDNNGFQVYNNIVDSTLSPSSFKAFGNGDSGTTDVINSCYFHHNTFVNLGSVTSHLIMVGNITDVENNKSFAYNNLAYNCNNPRVDNTGYTTGAIQRGYNGFLTCTGDYDSAGEGDGGNIINASAPNPFIDSANENFRLIGDTDVANMGKTDLGSPYNGNDYYGVARSATPDIGVSEDLSGSIYYVRAGATGTGTGADWTNAYTTLPSVLERDSIYYIADGTYGAYTFDDAEDGTKYIYIKKATTLNHGTETGWSSSYGDGQVVFTKELNSGGGNTWLFYTSYWVIDGQVGSGTSGHGFKVTGTGTGGTLKLAQMNSQKHYFEFHHIDFAHRGINLGGAPIEVSDDCIYFVIGSESSPAPPGASTNLIMDQCYFHDCDRVPVYISGMSQITIDKCVFARNEATFDVHSEGIQSTRGNAAEHVTVSNCEFIDIEGTAQISMGGGEDWMVFGNKFYFTSDYPHSGQNGTYTSYTAGSAGSGPITLCFFNNVIYNARGVNASLSCEAGSEVYEYNNIFENCAMINLNLSAAYRTNDYNMYYNISSWAGQQYMGEHSSILSSSILTNPSSFNFSITEQASGIDVSTVITPPVSWPSGYNTDPGGVTRGADGVWDIGAYEFTGGATVSGNILPSGYATEPYIVVGGLVLDITLTGGAIWDQNIGTDCAETTALIQGLDGSGTETFGWNNVVRNGLTYLNVERVTNTLVRITLPTFPTFQITLSETITCTVAAICTDLGIEFIATPTFEISASSPETPGEEYTLGNQMVWISSPTGLTISRNSSGKTILPYPTRFATEPIFTDEFNGTAVNETVWRIATWTDMGAPTSKSRCYVDAGYLNLEFTNDSELGWLGSAIQTRLINFMYGKWVARIKTSDVSGVVNAFFTIDWDGEGTHQEIDLEFVTQDQGVGVGTVHLAVHATGYDSYQTNPDIDLGFNPSDDFHIYTIEITPQKIVWKVDAITLGEYVYSENDITIDAGYMLKFNHWTSENVWVGGPPVVDTTGIYKIDYIRFYPYVGN